MSLGETIYRLRTERNLSQGDLADALDVSRHSVSKWENNSAVPELEKLLKMAEIFGITLDEMVRPNGPISTQTSDFPTSVQVQPIPGHRLMIPGILLLCFGVLLALFSLPLALPFWICGALCLILKRRHGLWCCWVVYFFITLWLYFSTTFSMDPFWTYLKALIVYGTARTHPATVLVAIANNAVSILMAVWTIRSYKNAASRVYSLRYLIIGWSITLLPEILREVSAALAAMSLTGNAGILGSTWWSLAHLLLQWAQLALTVIMLLYTVRALTLQPKD